MSSTEGNISTMQVELTYKAEPTLTMTCIAKIKSAEVCKELDEESGIEFGQVDLRVCLQAILNSSPELKKEEWSVYVLDPSEDKWSGNGTITSVIKDDESTPIVGKVKKKFRRETLEVELRLVKVPVSPVKKQPTLSLDNFFPLALQQQALHTQHPLQTMPTPSSPILPSHSPTLPTNRLLAPILQQNTPPPSTSNFQFPDQMWTDFEIPQQNPDFSTMFTDYADMNDLSFQYQKLQQQEQEQQQPFDIIQPPNPLPSPIPTSETPAPTATSAPRQPLLAPIPPPPPPGPPTPDQLLPPSKSPKRRKQRRQSSSKQSKARRQKKEKKEIVLPSSPPIRSFGPFAFEDLDGFLASETDIDVFILDPAEETTEESQIPASWHDFLHDTDPTIVIQETEEPSHPIPHVGFTAVNSTVEATREFTTRQILLNAEFTPNSSPSQSPSQTETDSGSPSDEVIETPFPTQDPSPSQREETQERPALADVTSHISALENVGEEVPALPQRKKRGRPTGWRKQKNSENPILPVAEVEPVPVKLPGRPKGSMSSNTPKNDDEGWSDRVRGNIKEVMLEKIAKGELPPMCAHCGDISPNLWRKVAFEGKVERFCNACALYYHRNGTLRPISSATPKKVVHVTRKRRKRDVPVEITASSPPPRELMSEIDHPLLSEGICLPRMGYLRGAEDTEETDDEKENVEPDDMERFFSDAFAA